MENNNYFKCILKGTIGTLLFNFIGIVILSSIMTKLTLTKNIFNVIYLIISLVSLACGAMIAARKRKSKGFYVGFGVTIFYCVTVYLIYTIVNGGYTFTGFELFKIIVSFIVGGLGGVLGVNMVQE